jgi:hypothetical protein
MVIGLERFEDFIQPFEKESPKIVKRAEIASAFNNMRSIVVIRFNHCRAI